jgi:hypothetical protein
MQLSAWLYAKVQSIASRPVSVMDKKETDDVSHL